MKPPAMNSAGRAGAPPRPRWVLWVLWVPCVLCFFPACTLLRGPKADRTEFFTLEALAPAGTPAPASAPRVLLRTVEVPAYLQRSKAFAVRQAEGDIHYADLAWWSESLDLGLARVLREDLNRLGVPTAARRDEDFVNELTIRIEKAEGVTDRKTGRVEFAASFELRRNDGPRPSVIRRTFTAEATTWNGKDYAALAKALGKAAADLAAMIREAALPRG
jgi:uncharacterized lipoprotein YmbA